MIIDNVQLNVDLNQLLSDLVVSIKSVNSELFSKGFKDSGNNIMVQCPYHSNGQEKRPSAGIHKETGVFHCFACGETHSLQEFISYCFGYDDGGLFGWKWLLKNYASVKVEERKDVKLDLARSKIDGRSRCADSVVPVSAGTDCCYVSEEELDSYRYIHPYMYKRGLTDEVIELFDIGYDKYRRCITFPVRDIKGHCLFIARRSVDYKYFNYPSGVEKPLYGLYELIKTVPMNVDFMMASVSYPDIIVCESMLDALSFWTVNKYAVALNGTGSALQFKQLRELPCRKLILCTDMDNAGMKARTNIRKNVTNKIITEYILPNDRKDANECTKDELKMLKDVIA